MEREIELLVNHRDAFHSRVMRISRQVGPPAQLHRPGVGGMRAAQYFHQRALARTVLADERMDLAGGDLKRDPAQRARRAKALLDVDESQPGGRGHHFKYLSSGGRTISAIAGSLKLAFVTKPTPVSIIGGTFSPFKIAYAVFTPR